jgi:hypothetical protein
MSSSISSSDPWRRFARTLLLTAAGVVGVLYAFVILVDPWDTLPLSPPLPRVPISSNARFSFPALARSPRFDSVILGTSTARLLQPAMLDPEFGARFANLAMNSATAWEQTQMLGVFLRSHPHPRAVIVAIDAAWCGTSADRLTPRPFPEWMYRPNLWPGYREMLTPYAVQEAANQFAVMTHMKRRRYGMDGYTSFVPPDSAYDPVRVDAAFSRWPAIDQTPAELGETVGMPALPQLAPALRAIPPGARVVLFFPPTHQDQHGAPGSRTALRWAACKQAVAALPGVTVLDFMIPSAITTDRANYWDPLHYRAAVAARVSALLGGAEGAEVRRLSGP